MSIVQGRSALAGLVFILFFASFAADARHADGGLGLDAPRPDLVAHRDNGLLPPPGPPADTGQVRDLDGLKRDAYYFIGGQFIIVSILYVMPESVSNWSEEQKEEYSFSKWRDNIGNVSYDSDRWWINYVLHPYWGGTYYVRARERGFDDHEAFWYSALLSALFEFGAEALFEEPSIQDLIFTPVGGYFFGHWFMDVRENIRAREASGLGLRFRDRAALVATDPIGVMSHAFDGWFGLGSDVEVSMVPFFVAERPLRLDLAGGNERRAPELVPGLQLHLTW